MKKRCKNPLNRRFPRELKTEFAKYLVLFVFLVGTIGFVSGFFVAGGSMSAGNAEGYEKYNIEDGNFEILEPAEIDGPLYRLLEAEGVSLHENFYVEEKTAEVDSTLRIFANRTEVNLTCLLSGALPQQEGEIAIDRVYAKNNGLSMGDTLTVGKQPLTVTGLVALSDYSALYQNPSDMMFDTTKFGVAVMTQEGFDALPKAHLHYCYSWSYHQAPADKAEARDKAADLLAVLAGNATVKSFIPAYGNQAIIFAGTDIGRDGLFMSFFLYVIMTVIAFVFAILTNNTITREAAVIGTLRASGYTRGELIRHYLAMPMIVTLLAAVIGNVLGYTLFKDAAAGLYYGSYSLPAYETRWNANAFVKTTVVPLFILFAIDLSTLVRKLRLTPLQFLRRDLSRRKAKRAPHLSERLGILKRFRLRVILQNLPNYVTIVIGTFLANAILLFGCGLLPMLEHYQQEIAENLIAKYQYVLKMPVETAGDDAETYGSHSLKTADEKRKPEDAAIYGIVKESAYVPLSFGDGVYVSSAYAAKFHLAPGDTVALRDEYENKDYSFTVDGIYDYPAGIAIFMDLTQFNRTFGRQDHSFNGYFSDKGITDIDQALIAAEVTEDRLTKTSRQLMTTFEEMAGMVQGFGIVFFMLVIYLLSKIIIEKNARSISMTKILGYSNAEINGLYVASTAMVVILSMLLTIPGANALIAQIIPLALADYSGYLFYYVPAAVFLKMALFGCFSYGVIAFLQTRRVKGIPLAVALKDVE